jgi:hypothetical protein
MKEIKESAFLFAGVAAYLAAWLVVVGLAIGAAALAVLPIWEYNTGPHATTIGEAVAEGRLVPTGVTDVSGNWRAIQSDFPFDVVDAEGNIVEVDGVAVRVETDLYDQPAGVVAVYVDSSGYGPPAFTLTQPVDVSYDASSGWLRWWHWPLSWALTLLLGFLAFVGWSLMAETVGSRRYSYAR